MDLVSRLRRFIDHTQMPVTQFADTCSIPRPTMSQLLSGRNKKVSNELIGKIHDAFPMLDVLWLMFGQGDMLVKENIAAIKPQESPSGLSEEMQSPDSRIIGNMVIHFDEDDAPEAEKSAAAAPPCTDCGGEGCGGEESEEPSMVAESTVNDEACAPYGNPRPGIGSLGRTICQAAAEGSRRIVNIIVYYSDNSFEAFIPERP